MKIIGLDIGTTSICGICCDTENGKILKSITRENDSFIISKNSWEKIQNANRIIDIINEIYNELITDYNDVVSIGVTGQMHGIVYLNKEGIPVSPLIIWQDGRGDLPYKDNLSYAEFITEKTDYKLATGYGCVSHFYNKVNNLIPKDAVTFCTIHDLAVMNLTDNNNPLIHSSNAASFGLFNLDNLNFDFDAITKLGLKSSFFPGVKKDYTIVGKTKDNIPVSVAIGDNQASILGSVKDLDNSLLINVGTGSQISVITNRAFFIEGIECRPLIDDKYLLVGSALCGGRAYAVLEKFLRETAITLSGVEIKSAYPIMDKLMADYKACDNTITVDTSFSGSREEPDKKGCIMGINTENLNVVNLCDAFMNGIVNELYCLYEKILFNNPLSIKTIIGSGNGIRYNKALVERFEAKFVNELKIPLQQEEAAFGAALYGYTAAGYCDNIQEAQKLIKY